MNLFQAGADRFESLLKEAGLKDQAKKVDKDMPTKQEKRFVEKFNMSEYAVENNLQLNINNVKMSGVEKQPDSGRMGTATAAVVIPGVTTIMGGTVGTSVDKSANKNNDNKMSDNSNNNMSPSGGGGGGGVSAQQQLAAALAQFSPAASAGSMGNNNGPQPAPAPAPSMSSSPASAGSSQGGGSSGGGSMGSSGGGGGGGGGGMGMSDINLKDNIQSIDNALNRLFNLNFDNGILS